MQAKRMYTNGRCPYCKRKILFYERNCWKYGSPVKKCKKCGERYMDSRYHEIAIEGIGSGIFSVKNNIIVLLISVGLLLLSYLIYMFEISYLGYYHISWYFVMGFLVFGIAYLIIDLIRILTGLKARKVERLFRESENRLSDKDYARELWINGYGVPKKYL